MLKYLIHIGIARRPTIGICSFKERSCDEYIHRDCKRTKLRHELGSHGQNVEIYISNSMATFCACNRIDLYYDWINKGFEFGDWQAEEQ